MKKIFFILTIAILLNCFIVTKANAFCQINLAKPGDLINTRDVTLSYVTLDTSDSAWISKIDFYYKKDGGSDSIKTLNTPNPSGEQVINLDSEGKHFFSAKAFYDNGESCSAGEVSTTIDTVSPSPLVSFGFARKDGSPTKYEICFKAPGDSDVSKVKIYRSDKEEFTADSGTEIHTEDISANQEKCWINDGLESGKDYYYAGRVLDKAGNASDPSYYNKTKTVTVEITPTPGAGGQGGTETALVETTEGGEVLGKETEVTPTPEKPHSATPTASSVRGKQEGKVLSAVDKVLPKSKSGKIVLIGLGIFATGLIIYFLLKRKEE